MTLAPAAPLTRFHLHPRVMEAIPARTRRTLAALMDVLATQGLLDEFGDRRVVDTPRRQLAVYLGTTARTVERGEKDLEELGLIGRVDGSRRRRVIELLDPRGSDAPALADRAVENRGPQAVRTAPEYDMGDVLSTTPVSHSNSALYISDLEGSEGRSANESRSEGGGAGSAQSARVDLDLAVSVARAVVGRVQATFDREHAERGGARTAWTFSRSQQSSIEERIVARFRALKRDGAGSLTVELVTDHVDRVAGFSVKADRPAAHFFAAIVRGDWRADAPASSTAAEVRAKGREAEEPVRDLDQRAGPPPRDPLATPAELARLGRARDAFGATDVER